VRCAHARLSKGFSGGVKFQFSLACSLEVEIRGQLRQICGEIFGVAQPLRQHPYAFRQTVAVIAMRPVILRADGGLIHAVMNAERLAEQTGAVV